jgi:hypothetical protein
MIMYSYSAPSYWAQAASGFYTPPEPTFISSDGTATWTEVGATCILPVAFYSPLYYSLPDPLSQTFPLGHPEPVMRHSDAALPAGQPIGDSISVLGQTMPVEPITEDATNTPDSDSEREARRLLLQQRMPPRSGIQAIIDRRRELPDPWLDDTHD